MKAYDENKLEVLANYLGVDANIIRVWSDDSLTVGSNDRIEYYVTKGEKENYELIGKNGAFNIYSNY